MSIVLGGERHDPPGLETISWRDDPAAVPRATDTSPRATWCRAIVVHTVHGRTGRLHPGKKPSSRAEIYARYQARSERKVSWDATIDTDGTVAWSNDPLAYFTWHALQVNPYVIGIELVQDDDGTLYAATLEAAYLLIDYLTATLGIQRQIPWRDGKPYAGRIERCDPGRDGRALVGVYGHRNVWGWPEEDRKKPLADRKLVPYRGFGDPGDHVFMYLRAHGYETFDPTEAAGHAPDDIATWKRRQYLLGMSGSELDGVPGPLTVKALKNSGYRNGLWVRS